MNKQEHEITVGKYSEFDTFDTNKKAILRAKTLMKELKESEATITNLATKEVQIINAEAH